MRTLCGAAEGIGPFLRSGTHVRILHLPYIFYQPFIVSIEIVACLCGFGRNAQTLRRTVQNLVQQLVIHFLKRSIKCETITFNERLYLPEYHRLTRFPQRGYSSLAHRKRTVWEHLVDVNQIHIAKTLTLGAGTHRTVEGEVVGRGVTVRDSAYGTHKPAAEVAHLSRIHIIDHHHAVALRHGVRHA